MKDRIDMFSFTALDMDHQMVKNLCIFIKKNGYTEVKNGSKYLTLISVDENKDEIKTYKEA